MSVQAAVEATLSIVARMFNNILRMGIFSEHWKVAKLIEKKVMKRGTGYRPICLINVAGKLVEEVIVKWLQQGIVLSENQFSFTKKQSTRYKKL